MIWASWAALHGCPVLPLHPRDAVVLASATLPAPAAIAIGVGSATSGVGSGLPTAAFVASCTRKYWPGCNVTSGSSVSCVALTPRLPVPVALAYCTDQPFSDTGVVPRLNSSTKSCVNVAPVLPPPPYTWLITTPFDSAATWGADPTDTASNVDDSVESTSAPLKRPTTHSLRLSRPASGRRRCVYTRDAVLSTGCSARSVLLSSG